MKQLVLFPWKALTNINLVPRVVLRNTDKATQLGLVLCNWISNLIRLKGPRYSIVNFQDDTHSLWCETAIR